MKSNKDFLLAIYFKHRDEIKTHCSVPACIEFRYPGYTDTRIINSHLALIILPESCSIFSIDFIITAAKSITTKLSIAQWGYQFDTFLYTSDPHSKVGLTYAMKQNLTLSSTSCPPITYVPIFQFMSIQEENDKKYNKASPFWSIIITTACSTLFACPLVFLLIQLKCAKEYSQYAEQHRNRKPKNQPTIETIPLNPTTKPKIKICIQKALEEKPLTSEPTKHIYGKIQKHFNNYPLMTTPVSPSRHCNTALS